MNKRLFNPGVVRRGAKPIVRHVGRRTGTSYLTPMDAHPTTDGFVLVVRYGPDSDWVRNILAAGGAALIVDGSEHAVGAPRLVTQQEAADQLRPGVDPGRDFFKAEHYLLVDHRS
ncbi:MAG: nitroreductase family deazaflavin-dependent oxidoreductase [Acidimicrobiia bacterium]